MHPIKQLAAISLLVVGMAALECRTASAQARNPNRVYQLNTLKVTKVSAAGHTLELWIMDTEGKNNEGMMFLTDKEVRNDQGMLFLFRNVQRGDRDHSFWMHNTLLPLDIIYIDAHKRVVNIAEGKPMDDTPLPAARDYLYVVELKRGTAKRLGIKPGTKFDISSGLKWAG